MIHMLDIGIGIDGGIGLYCRKQHLDRFVIVDSIVQMFFFLLHYCNNDLPY